MIHPNDPREKKSALVPNQGSSLPAESGSASLRSESVWPAGTIPWDNSAAGESGASFSRFANAFRRKWPAAVGVGLLVAMGIAALLWVVLPVNHEAVALIRVSRVQPGVLQSSNNRSGRYDFDVLRQTQVGILKSEFVLLKALQMTPPDGTRVIGEFQTLEQEDQPVKWLQENLQVQFTESSEFIHISLRGERPDEIQGIVDTVVAAYINEVYEEEDKQRRERRTQLVNDQERLNREIRQDRIAINNIRLEHQLPSTDLPAVANALRMAEMEMRLSRNRVERLRSRLNEVNLQLQVQRNKLFQARDYQPTNSAIEDELDRDRLVYDLKQQIEALKTQISIALQTNRQGSPVLAGLQAELTARQRELKKRERELRDRVVDRLRRNSEFNPERIASVVSALESESKLIEKDLAEAEADFKKEFQAFTESEGSLEDLRSLEDSLATRLTALREVNDELNRLNIESNAPKRIITFQDAQTKLSTSSVIRIIQVCALSILSLGAVVFGFLLFDIRKRRVNSPNDVSSGARIRVIGSIPSLRGGARRWAFGRVSHETFSSAVKDAVDSVRAALMHLAKGETNTILMVTSADEQEGKTTVASQLAASLARCGRRTLLIDGDLRNPTQHELFGLPQVPGLCDLLGGRADLDDVLQRTPLDGLSLLPAGFADELSLQGLAGDAIDELFDELRARFDYVVIDAGPALSCPDAMVFGQHADATLLSVRRDVSEVPRVYEAWDRLRALSIHVLGAVVNGATPQIRRAHVALSYQRQDTSDSAGQNGHPDGGQMEASSAGTVTEDNS